MSGDTLIVSLSGRGTWLGGTAVGGARLELIVFSRCPFGAFRLVRLTLMMLFVSIEPTIKCRRQIGPEKQRLDPAIA